MNSFATTIRRGFTLVGGRSFATLATQHLALHTSYDKQVRHQYNASSFQINKPTHTTNKQQYGYSYAPYINHIFGTAAAAAIVLHRDDDATVAQCMPSKKKKADDDDRKDPPELRATKAGFAPTLGGLVIDDDSDRAFDCVSYIDCVLF